MKKIDFLTDADIKREELRILCMFDAFCKEYELRYSLAFGTLLGAIRHQGFIPWDDDIDVCMPRPDYEKLIVLSPNLLVQHNLRIDNIRTEKPFPIAFSKIVNPDIYVSEENLTRDLDEHLWIDVFPVDGIQLSPRCFNRLLKKHWNRMRLLGIGLHRHPSFLREIAQGIIRFFSPSPFQIAKRIDHDLSSFDFEAASYVSDIVGSDPGKSILLNKESFLKSVSVTFEGRSFPAMGCWREYLTGFYGDYQQLPPPEERVSHRITAWREVCQ